jgi:Ca-activated chloride channel family protein
VRIGVVAFSGTSALVQPPTREKEEVLVAINRLATQRGTAVGSGILTSLKAIFEDAGADSSLSLYEIFDPGTAPESPVAPGSYTNAVIVLLSDGQGNQGPNPLEVAERAANLGVRVFTVGVGSKEGTIMNFFGRAIRVQLDEEALKSIARKTDGGYFKAENEAELVTVYETLSLQLVAEVEKTELTAFFTAAAALLMLVAAVLSMIWFKRVV